VEKGGHGLGGARQGVRPEGGSSVAKEGFGPK
jgi:hypothetical protein